VSKLTKAQRRVLEWMLPRGDVAMFPHELCRLSFVKRLDSIGLIERAGQEGGMLGFVKFRVSAAGRRALEEQSDG